MTPRTPARTTAARRTPASTTPVRRARSGRRAALPALAIAVAAAVAGCAGSDGDDPAVVAPTDEPDGGTAADLEVVIPADGLDLVGTLRLPDGEPPHTGVVIAHGSGPHDRRGELPGQLGLSLPQPVAVYEQLAEGLRDAGFAVATFDKRTCGPFNGCADNGYPTPPADLRFDDLTADVGAVVDHLADREDIGAIAVIGHSKGGTMAAQLAIARDDLAGVVLLATPAAGIDEVLADQAARFEELIAGAGQQGAGADVAVAELRGLAEEVAAIADGALDGPPVGGVDRGFWVSWLAATDAVREGLATTDAAVLALGGGADWNVRPDRVEAWAPLLPAGGEVAVLDGITHVLTRLDQQDPTAITPADVGTAVDPLVVDRLVTWLRRLADG